MKAILYAQSGPPPMVVSWLDDVLYPFGMYRAGACRVGGELLRVLLGVDVYADLVASYRAGYELEVVRQVVQARVGVCDARVLVKVAAAMEAHAPNVSPYQDALETFPLLQTLGVPLALVGEGSRIGQRLIAEQLRLHGVFQHMVYADPHSASLGWCNAFMMLEGFGGLSRENAVIICADASRVQSLAADGWLVVHLQRDRSAGACAKSCGKTQRVFSVVNLYELPEALGLVAWGDGEEVNL